MKEFLVVVALAAVACATDLRQNAEPSELQPQLRVFEAQIKERIKAFIEQLGDPSELKDVKLQTDDEYIKIDLSLTGTVAGLSNYQIPKLTLSLVGFKFTFKFVIPELDVDISSYNLTGSLYTLPMHGTGTIVTSVKNIVLEGTGKLGSKGDGFVFLENINVGVTIDDFKFAISGWLDDAEQSEKFSKLIQQVVPDVLSQYPAETSRVVSDLIRKLAEGIHIKFP